MNLGRIKFTSFFTVRFPNKRFLTSRDPKV